MPLTVLSVAYPLAPVSAGTAGGAEQILLTLDRALVRQGHRSIVLAAAGSQCQGLLRPVPIPAAHLDQNAKCEARSRFRMALSEVLQEFHVDVVHMHGVDFADYLPACDIPIVVSLHLPLSWYPPGALRPANRIQLVCVSRSQAQTAPPGVRIDRVICNGVDIQHFRPGARKGDYVLSLGRICPEKGLHLAMEAAELAGENLFIAGSVFDYREHRDYFEKLIYPGLNSTAKFLGPVGGKRKAALLAGAKCLLIPSLAPETSSLIAMESMAAGTPVVAWKSGALPEIVCDGRTGFLVSSVVEMASAIKRINALKPAVSRQYAEQKFAAKPMIDSYLDLYTELCSAVPDLELSAA